MKENKLSWEEIYKKGASYLEYPNEALVICYHRIKGLLSQPLVCLDYGFGSGNNSEFILTKADEFYGLEISEEAKEVTTKRLGGYPNFDKENLFLSNGDFVAEFENKFNLVVAWHVLSYNNEETIINAIENIYRYLKKDGLLIATLATPRDISKKFSKKISNNHYIIDERIPSQKGCSVVIPEDHDDFRHYFSQFSPVDIGKEERLSFEVDDLHSHYYGVFKKP